MPEATDDHVPAIAQIDVRLHQLLESVRRLEVAVALDTCVGLETACMLACAQERDRGLRGLGIEVDPKDLHLVGLSADREDGTVFIPLGHLRASEDIRKRVEADFERCVRRCRDLAVQCKVEANRDTIPDHDLQHTDSAEPAPSAISSPDSSLQDDTDQ